MCGIFAYDGKRNDAPSLVLKGLKQLEYRGYDSWGIAFLPNDNKINFVTEKHLGKIGSAQLKEKISSNLAIGHTRWATHGGVTVANTHPHFDSQRNLALVHNGIIENYQQLKLELQNKGYEFVSETDSEVAVNLIAENLKTNDFLHAAQKAFLDMEGCNAFVIVNKNQQQIIAFKKGSPLVFGMSDKDIFIASDATAISEYTDTIHFLNDNEILFYHQQQADLFDLKHLKEKKFHWEKLDFDAQEATKGNFEHFLLKEASEQPVVLTNIAQQLTSAIKDYAKNLDGDVAFVGCGSAYHAALQGSYFFGAIAKQSAQAYMGSEFADKRALATHAFTTFISQSGETIDIVEHAQFFKEKGFRFGTIVNRLGSSLERLSSQKIHIPAGPEQCVLSTKAYTGMVAILYLLAAERVNKLDESKELLKEAATSLNQILAADFVNEHLKPLAKKLASKKDMFVFGRGVSYPLSMEAALKIKEVTYLHAEGFAAGELKHGVIALIEQGTPCIVFAPADETYDSIISNAIEVKSRGALVIGISPKNNQVFDIHIPVPDVGMLTLMPNILVSQLLAYYIALELGNDPDKPRNLAKSVTVK